MLSSQPITLLIIVNHVYSSFIKFIVTDNVELSSCIGNRGKLMHYGHGSGLWKVQAKLYNKSGSPVGQQGSEDANAYLQANIMLDEVPGDKGPHIMWSLTRTVNGVPSKAQFVHIHQFPIYPVACVFKVRVTIRTAYS